MKVLFFHPSNYLEIGIPQGIAILSARLREHGHDTALFDTTFLKPAGYAPTSADIMAGPTIFKKTPYTLEDLVKDDPVASLPKEFQKKIDSYGPDLIAVSAMTTNYDFALRLLKKIKRNCPVIVGGVHATLSPLEVLSDKAVDMICVGEGDDALPELCDVLERGKDPRGIRNIWTKSPSGRIVRTEPRPLVKLDDLPCPDWSLFDPSHLFRPFQGRVYTGGFYISSRGCPSGCSYCVNATLRGLCRHCGPYFRYESPATTIGHLRTLKKRYGATWFKFGDDTFLLRPLHVLEELRDGIKPLKILFGCSVRPDTVTEEKVRLAREMGCVAMSVGIETGNEEIRRRVLNRKISNAVMERAFEIITRQKIRISSFNLIGIPGETRENVFETIRFNRALKVQAANVYIVYPFPGSAMARDHRVKCRKRNGTLIPMSRAAVFKLSKMPPREVEGLRKTFNLYLSLPEELWPIVRLAEAEGTRADLVYGALNQFAAAREA